MKYSNTDRKELLNNDKKELFAAYMAGQLSEHQFDIALEYLTKALQELKTIEGGTK